MEEEDNRENRDQIREEMEKLIKHLPQIIEQYEHYKKMPVRTPDEEADYHRLEGIMQKALHTFGLASEYLNDKLYRQSVAYYYNVKQKAQEGDPVAKSIYDDLAPLFHESLRGQMGGEN